MNNHTRHLALYAFIALVTLGIVFYFATPVALVRPEPQIEETARISASLTIDGVLARTTTSVSPDTSALSLLERVTQEQSIPLTKKDYTGMGTLVVKIGGLENGSGGKYWHYYVNGVLAPVGADAYIVREGDTLEWRFHEPDEGL